MAHAAAAGAAAAASAADEDDEVVLELDVLVSNELAAMQSQLVMLQQPLRPNWRPYDTYAAGATARFRPNARRLELSLPLDTASPNYGDAPPDGGRAPSLTLRSSPVEEPVVAAVGVVRDGALVLLPVDFTAQLRPDMSFVGGEGSRRRGGAAAAGAGEGEGESEEADDAGAGAAEEPLTAVEVTVKRRETERQQQARLKSFSYLQQEEQQEAWVPLKLHTPDAPTTEKLWDRLLSAPQAAAAVAAAGGGGGAGAGSSTAAAAAQQMPPPLSRAEYLRSFVPASAAAAAAAAAAAEEPPLSMLGAQGGAAAAGAAGGRGDGAGGGAGADVVTPEMQTTLGPFIHQLVVRHPVCSMANVRQWLQQQEREPLARVAAQLPDMALEGLLMSSGHTVKLQRMFVARTGTNVATEPLRKVVVKLLEDAKVLRKADVMRAAEAGGLSPTESQYQRVMRELCRNNGNHWTIKTSADM